MNYIKELQLKDFIRLALAEDIGRQDITTESIIPKTKFVKVEFIAKENFVVCGLHVAGLVFKVKDKSLKFIPRVRDGQQIKRGKILAQVSGRARSILSAERVALNFVSLLSGVATKTRKYVERVRPYKARILDTRKTLPGLRELEKYAVRTGGGYNHRMRLDEMILVKDNHIKVVGNRLWVVGFKKIRNKASSKIETEIEVNNLSEFKNALKLTPDIIMLDNMSVENMKKAVKIRNNLSPTTYHLQPKLEASGGITLKNVKKIAATGVDFISVGALTHSVDSVDISLEIL